MASRYGTRSSVQSNNEELTFTKRVESYQKNTETLIPINFDEVAEYDFSRFVNNFRN